MVAVSTVVAPLMFAACTAFKLRRSGAPPSARNGGQEYVPPVQPADVEEFFQSDGPMDRTRKSSYMSDNARMPVGWDPMPAHGEGPAGWEGRILVVPDIKFAFCWIDKNAGTQFNLLLNALNNITDKRTDLPHFKSSIRGGKGKGLHFEELSGENGWRWAIFLRDPAERFLSAWLSKCVAEPMEDGGNNCMGIPKHVGGSEEGKVEQFEEVVLEQLPKYMQKVRTNGYFNAHYDPQSHFCNAKPLSDYDFVGQVTGDHAVMSKQVRSMLTETARLSTSVSHVWEVVDRLFPSKDKKGHHTDAVQLMRSYYQNNSTYAAVVRAYAEDYEKLKLPAGHYRSVR